MVEVTLYGLAFILGFYAVVHVGLDLILVGLGLINKLLKRI